MKSLPINRKGLAPVTHQFRGFMVQCLNEFPRLKDKSESLYRRQLYVPFRKWFGDSENRAIKDDYLRRPEVHRFLVMHVLLAIEPFYELDEPAACKEVLNEAKQENDSVRDFWLEHETEFVWDLLPAEFLYDAYKSWATKTRPGGFLVGMTRFRKAVERLAAASSFWERSPAEKTRPGARMDRPELMIVKYGLDAWANQAYSGVNPNMRARTTPATNYRWCLVRRGPSVSDQEADA